MSHNKFFWGAGAGVCLAAVNSALINELHGGWPWWAAAALATVAGAVLTGWLVTSTADSEGSLVVEAGGVYAGRNISGRVRTRPGRSRKPTRQRRAERWIGRGAVAAGEDIAETADIDTTGDRISDTGPPRTQGGSQ
jgi:hypothetical protein